MIMLSGIMLAGCGASNAKKTIIVNVFVAASMTETLSEIESVYEKEHSDVDLVFTVGSSGDLKTQIEEGAACDIFISAGQSQMDQLDVGADDSVNIDGLDFVKEGSRKNLLENRVTLCVADNSKLSMKSFDELASVLKENDNIKFAMGNRDVPVGQYTQKILEYYNIDEAYIATKITYGSDVKEVTTQIIEGSVDCGVVYKTDAYSAGLTPVDEATATMCGQVIYPAAVMKASENIDVAQDFLDYLLTDEATEIFEKVGFTAIR